MDWWIMTAMFFMGFGAGGIAMGAIWSAHNRKTLELCESVIENNENAIGELIRVAHALGLKLSSKWEPKA